MNHYQLLGVSRNADQADIKKAFKKLAVQYHPDKNPGSAWAEKRFKEINNAYQVLSDPNKKSVYDLSLTYQYHRSTARNSPPSKPYQYQRKTYQTQFRKYNSKKNRQANWWALGIIATLFLVYITVFGINYWMEQSELARLEAIDQDILSLANQKYEAGVYHEALELLDQHLSENGRSKNINDTKETYLSTLRREGNLAYERGDFSLSLEFFKPVYAHGKNLNDEFYQRVARASAEVGNFQDALDAYQYLIDKMPERMDPYLQVALLYSYELKDYPAAIEYFQKARELTINHYVEEYGKAFVLVFNPGRIPETHYLLYSGLGYTQYHLGNLKEAKDALEWAIILRRYRPEAYYIKALIFNDENDPAKACQNLNRARQNGLRDVDEALDDVCS